MPSPADALHDDAAYRALRTRDARFDGRFFVGVTSTGIYCRPVCRVRPPRRENCRFFASAAGAEHGGFRPCLRCRPELAPGLSLADSSATLAAQAARMLSQAVHDGTDLACRVWPPGWAWPWPPIASKLRLETAAWNSPARSMPERPS
jgi:methylphosphotriester-DNA--protein-cysteine methyltransferase